MNDPYVVAAIDAMGVVTEGPEVNPANPVMVNPITASRDATKGTIPRKENKELAEDLLAQFPGVDRAELLKDMVASCFFDLRHGNKREERAACDFLNEVQRIAIRNVQASKLPPSPAN